MPVPLDLMNFEENLSDTEDKTQQLNSCSHRTTIIPSTSTSFTHRCYLRHVGLDGSAKNQPSTGTALHIVISQTL